MLKELVGDGMMRKLYCLCACLLLLACSIPVFPLVMASFIQEIKKLVETPVLLLSD